MKNRFMLPTVAFFAFFAATCNLDNTNMRSNATSHDVDNSDNSAPNAAGQNQNKLRQTLSSSNATMSKNNRLIYNVLQNLDAPTDDVKAILTMGEKIQRLDKLIDAYLQENAQKLVINYPQLSQMYAAIVDSMKAQNAALKFALMPNKAEIENLNTNEKLILLETIRFDVLANYHELLVSTATTANTALTPSSFGILANSAKPAIVLGEEYRAEIMLYSPSMLDKYAIHVNGSGLSVNGGKAVYRTRPNNVGEQSYTANVRLTNPMTGEALTATKEFRFTVAALGAFIQKEGSHVLYLGEDNQLTVLASGISSNDISVTASGTAGAQVLPAGKSTYTVKVKQKGTAALTITDKKGGKTLGVYTFEVKTR